MISSHSHILRTLSIPTILILIAFDCVSQPQTRKDFDNKIIRILDSIDEISRVEWVRTRRAGENIFVDLMIALHRNYTVKDSDTISKKIREYVSRKLEQPLHTINVEFCCFS